MNCLVPAKLGDLYRAYLLKINSTGVAVADVRDRVHRADPRPVRDRGPRPRGRLLVSFRAGLPADVQFVFAIGVGVVVVLAAGLLTMRNFGRRIIPRLPLPHRVLEFYDRFEEGVFAAVGLRALPRLIVLTGLIWATEAMRLFLVVEALGFPDVHLGISGAFFVALTGSLLTAVPLTPAGLGVVETGVVGRPDARLRRRRRPRRSRSRSSTGRSACSRSSSSARIAYWFSPKRRGMGLERRGRPRSGLGLSRPGDRQTTATRSAPTARAPHPRIAFRDGMSPPQAA